MSSSKPFPGFASLHSFQRTGASRDFTVDIEYPAGGDPLAVTRGKQQLVGKARARWAMGSSKPGEVIWTRFVGPVLLREDLVNAMKAAGSTGWSTYPVEVKGKSGESLPDYHGLIVLGRCRPVSTERSMRVMKEFPSGFFPVLRGLAFDETSWDGSDVFMPEDGTAWVFVTEVVRSLISARAKNVRFTPMEEIEQQVM